MLEFFLESSRYYSLSSSYAYFHARLAHTISGPYPRHLGLSPFRQRAAQNLISSYIFNGYRRLSGQLVYWVIPFAMGTLPIQLPSSPSLPLLHTSRHPLVTLARLFIDVYHRLRYLRMGEAL